jgi:SAM-dependent methyltransferase
MSNSHSHAPTASPVSHSQHASGGAASPAAVMQPVPLGSTGIHGAYRRITAGIEGWFGDGAIAVWDSLLAFQRRERVSGHMLEIGVHHGKSAALLAMYAEPGTKVLLVDHGLKTAQIEKSLMAARPAPGVEFVTVHGDSRELAVNPLVSETFRAHRWIHIDGEHSAGAVTSDMRIANQLLAKEGVLVIDDFFSWLYPQVTEAVLRYVRQNPDDFALFLCGFNKAYLARPHFAHRYLAFCAEELPGALEARGQDTTVGKTTFPAEMNVFGVGPRFQGKALRGPDWEDTVIRY